MAGDGFLSPMRCKFCGSPQGNCYMSTKIAFFQCGTVLNFPDGWERSDECRVRVASVLAMPKEHDDGP